MGRGPAISQEPFTACASSPHPLRTPPGSSASIASKPAILAKIMHRRPAADLSGCAADPGVMHAVRLAGRAREAAASATTKGQLGFAAAMCVRARSFFPIWAL